MKILNLKATPEADSISQAVSVLRRGGLLIYPTETVYGAGVDVTNQQAVNKLLKFKGQRGLKPILIAVSDQKMAEKCVELNDAARRLYQTFLPGPVAVISRMKRSRSLATGISSPDGTVGIRIPDYPLILKIIQAFGKPITSSSANISGARNPWSIQDILETTPKQKLELIDLIIDAGQLPKRPPSTVIDTTHEETEIVRQGEVGIKAILNTEYRMVNEKYASQSPRDTQQIAQKFLRRILSYSEFSIQNSVLVIALQGPLGAGKTVFAKGIARALGITDPIRSPSYTLVREYKITKNFSTFNFQLSFLYHVDAWRLSDPNELQDLSLESMLKPGNIIVIEWIERLESIVKRLQEKSRIVLVNINVRAKDKRHIQITM